MYSCILLALHFAEVLLKLIYWLIVWLISFLRDTDNDESWLLLIVAPEKYFTYLLTNLQWQDLRANEYETVQVGLFTEHFNNADATGLK